MHLYSIKATHSFRSLNFLFYKNALVTFRRSTQQNQNKPATPNCQSYQPRWPHHTNSSGENPRTFSLQSHPSIHYAHARTHIRPHFVPADRTNSCHSSQSAAVCPRKTGTPIIKASDPLVPGIFAIVREETTSMGFSFRFVVRRRPPHCRGEARNIGAR